MRGARRALFGSYCREHTRGRRLIVLALQATMDSDIPKKSRSDGLFLRGRHDAQEPRPVGVSLRKWVFFLRRSAKLYASLKVL